MSQDLPVQLDPNVYSLPILSQGSDDAGADLLTFDGDLTDVLAGSVLTINRRYVESVRAVVVSAVYDAATNQTLARFAKGTFGDTQWKWVTLLTPVVSPLAQQDTDDVQNPNPLSRLWAWLGF